VRKELTLERNREAQELYDLVLQTSNEFLYNCKRYRMELLRCRKPTYNEVAAAMRELSEIVTVLADDFDPMMGQKAVEYCQLMSGIGVAIERFDGVRLLRLVAELERRPGL
jgi:hypothetical protein